MKTVTFGTRVIPNWISLAWFYAFSYYVGLPG